MIGYIQEAQAKAEGFTHHGLYYGLPIWIALNTDEPMVAAKVVWLDWLIPIISTIENIVRSIMRPGDESGFMFTITREIT